MSKQTQPNRFYVYVYLDPRKPGHYKYGEYSFEFEPFYVGKGTESRAWSHLKKSKDNIHFNNIIKKIQRTTGGDPIVVIYKENILDEEAYAFEGIMVDTIGRKVDGTGPLCNILAGGYGIPSGKRHPLYGKHLSEDHKKKISESNKGVNGCWYGKTFSEEHKRKLKENHVGNTGKTLTLETRKKISESRIGMVFSEEHRKNISKSKTGMKQSDEHKQKISKTLTGRVFSEEHKQKIRDKNITDSFREKMSDIKSFTWTIVYPDGHMVTIKNLKRFCEMNNLDNNSMARVANGRQNNHKGFKAERIKR